MSKQETALDVRMSPVVQQAISTVDAVKQFEAFQELKTKLLKDDDYQTINNKPFVKKSGWRKLATVFNVSDEIVECERKDRADNSFVWTFRVRAIAPNGRFSEAIGSCDSNERKFSKLEHDVKATAHTRAKSRAISDLIGAGEVSAEEMEQEDQQQQPPKDAKNVTPKKQDDVITPPPLAPKGPAPFEDSMLNDFMWQEQPNGTEIASALNPIDNTIFDSAESLIAMIRQSNGKFLVNGWAYFYSAADKRFLRRKEPSRSK
jgi:hypothetical protein